MDIVIRKDNELILHPDVCKQIAEFKKQADAIEAAQLELKKEIQKAMEKNSIKKLDNDVLTITYYDASYKESFDSKALRAENEDLYNQYIKISPVKPFIKLKVK